MPSLIIRCCFFLTFLLRMSHVSLLHASSAACPIEWVKLYTYVPCTCVFALLSFRDTWACCRLFYLNPSPFLSLHYHFLSLSLPFKQRKLPFFITKSNHSSCLPSSTQHTPNYVCLMRTCFSTRKLSPHNYKPLFRKCRSHVDSWLKSAVLMGSDWALGRV